MDLGKPIMEPDLESQAQTATDFGNPIKMPKGGEI
jgi:hypothetical protein